MADNLKGRGKRGEILSEAEILLSEDSGGQKGSNPETIFETDPWSLEISPNSATIGVGQTQQFTATLTDGQSSRDVTDEAYWSSSVASSAPIDGRGLATGKAQNPKVMIIATHGRYEANPVDLTVSAPVLVSIAVSPFNTSLPAGQTLQFTATGTYSDGTWATLDNAVWGSSAPNVASIDSSGMATGISASDDPAIIYAAVGAISGGSPLTVLPVLVSIDIGPQVATIGTSAKQQFKALGKFSNGSYQDLTATSMWSVSPAGTVTFDPTNPGLVTGANPGSVPISATITAADPSSGMSGIIGVSVTPVVLTAITVNAPSNTVAIGQTLQLTAVGTYSDGSQKIIPGVSWTSSSNGIATIGSQSGLLQAVSPGAVTVTAAANGLTGTVQLAVSGAALVSITITPPNPSVTAGKFVQLTAVGSYSDQTSKNLTTTLTWNSTSPNIATVINGLVTGVAAGSTIIAATDGSSGISANTTANVTAQAVLSSVTVSPSTASMGAGRTLQLTATANYSDGTTQPVTTQASWTSSNVNVAGVSQGLVTGVGLSGGPTGSGSATIQATYSDTNSSAGQSGSATVTILLNFGDLGDADTKAFNNSKSRVNQLLTAFERRGNLSDAELLQLQDGLELVTQFLNNNPTTSVPNFNAASKAGNNVSDLALLGLAWNADRTKGPIGTGSGKSNVIDDRFRAICDYLYGKPPIPGQKGLEHDPGSFPGGTGPNPGGLTDDQLRVAAIYGYVLNTLASPPPYQTNPNAPDDTSRRSLFNQTVEAADAKFRGNTQLYVRTMARLVQTVQTPQLQVSDFSKVVDLLVQQGISPINPQLNIWIDRALATAQNVGQDALPSQIDIDLPDLEQDVSNYEIISGNIFALQPAYFCSMLEELKVFQVVEKLVELFQNGVLPVIRGDAGNQLFAWWKTAALRVSETERRGFYARSLGFPGGDADAPNREFKSLFMRFVSAVSSFVRQNTVDNLLRSNIPGAISQQQVRKSARDLATNISSHGYGIAHPMATELQKEINDVMSILKNSEVQNAYGAKDPWQLVDQVAALELGGAANSVKYRTMASAGAVVFAWLAGKSQLLATNSYVPIIDITMLQNPPSFSTKPTTNPSDFDLVGACDQWLAVTGTQEDSVEEAAQPVEAPVMPSRPIQIPSVARDVLESVGIPAMSYSASQGKPNGAYTSGVYNWRSR